MRGQGSPMYSTVRCQVWKSSVSLLPQHDVCFFSHDQCLVTCKATTECLFKSQMRTGRQDLARQATSWKIREGLGGQRPKQSPMFQAAVQCIDLVNGPFFFFIYLEEYEAEQQTPSITWLGFKSCQQHCHKCSLLFHLQH